MHRVTELHSIQAINNIPSILQHGILSHESASQLPHTSVAMNEVQERRAKVMVPGGLRLHQYANLYFCARNPMLFKRLNIKNQLCILRIDRHILSHPGVIITDQNAAADFVRFLKSPEGLKLLDFDMIYADDWRHPNNPSAYYHHRKVKCAEVLIPHYAKKDYILGAYVANNVANTLLSQYGFNKPVHVNSHIFFS